MWTARYDTYILNLKSSVSPSPSQHSPLHHSVSHAYSNQNNISTRPYPYPPNVDHTTQIPSPPSSNSCQARTTLPKHDPSILGREPTSLWYGPKYLLKYCPPLFEKVGYVSNICYRCSIRYCLALVRPFEKAAVVSFENLSGWGLRGRLWKSSTGVRGWLFPNGIILLC